MISRLSHAGVFAASVFALTACVSVLPEQPKPEAVYQISAPSELIPLATNVVIREPDAPRLFASRNIASEDEDGGLRVVPGIAWADRATRMLQVTMIDAFSAEGEGVAVDDATGVSGDYELYWRITDFSLKGNDGYCALQLTLLDGGSRVPVAQETVSARATSTGKGAQARARSLADAGRDCVSEAARRVAAAAVEPR